MTTSQSTVISSLPASIREKCYLVGRWVWCEFKTKPDRGVIDSLRAAGFRFNGKRKLWQHSCGVRSRRATGYDPRSYYGIKAVTETEER